jgi:hypothetical protein
MKTATAKKPETTEAKPKSVIEKLHETPPAEMARLMKIDEVMGKLFDINEATSDLASIMNEWHPSGVPTESNLMPPTALVNLLSDQYEAFAEYLNDALLALKKGGAA